MTRIDANKLALELQAPLAGDARCQTAARELIPLLADERIAKLVKATRDRDVRAAYARLLAAAMAVRDVKGPGQGGR